MNDLNEEIIEYALENGCCVDQYYNKTKNPLNVYQVFMPNMNLSFIPDFSIFKNTLKMIDLSGNKIEKIENLSELKKLKFINLSKNYIEKIEGLENCKDLIGLDLSYNNIYKIEGLDNLKHLEQINLMSNQINNINQIKTYKPLKLLNLKDNALDTCVNRNGLNNLYYYEDEEGKNLFIQNRKVMFDYYCDVINNKRSIEDSEKTIYNKIDTQLNGKRKKRRRMFFI